jgi:hypothetical protein
METFTYTSSGLTIPHSKDAWDRARRRNTDQIRWFDDKIAVDSS